MYVVGVGLVKGYNALIRLVSGSTLRPPSDVCVRSFLCPFFTLIKLCYTKALEWSRLVPNPEAKSSSGITDPTSFTISYQCDHVLIKRGKRQTHPGCDGVADMKVFQLQRWKCSPERPKVPWQRAWLLFSSPVLLKFECLFRLVYQNKIPQSGCLNDRNLFLTVLETGASEYKVSTAMVPQWGLSRWLADNSLLTVSSHGGERERSEQPSSSYKDTNPIVGALPSQSHLNLLVSQRLYFQIP